MGLHGNGVGQPDGSQREYGDLVEVNRFVSATGKAVDDALVNSGHLINESLVQISDANASPAEAALVLIREGAREVYDGATPIVGLEENHKTHIEARLARLEIMEWGVQRQE